MHPINLSLIFIAGLNVGMGLLIFLRNPKNKINISFSITILMLAGWIFGVSMFREATTETVAWIWSWVQNGFGSFLVVPFFLFSLYFPYQNFVLKLWHKVLIILSLVVITYVVVMPGVWVVKINLHPHANDYVLNMVGLAYFNLHFFFYLMFTFYNLIKKYIDSEGIFKSQLRYLIWGTGIMAFFGSMFSSIYPLATQTLGPYWIASYFSLPMIIILTHLIFKKVT